MLSRGVVSLCRMVLNQAKPSTALYSHVRTQPFHSTLPKPTTYYAESHEWISVNNDVGTVGISKHAKEQLGDVVFCELPEVDISVEKGVEFGVVESVKAASDVYSPVSGQVVLVNDIVMENPSLISESPMDNGWLIKIKLSNAAELDDLMNAEEYDAFIKE